MKNILGLALFIAAMSSHATFFMKTATCNGVDSEGEKVEVTIHLEEAYFCSSNANGKYEGLVNIKTEDSDDMFSGEVSEKTIEGKNFTMISYTTLIEDSNTGLDGESVTIEAGFNYAMGIVSTSFEADDESEADVTKLICNTIEYHMDCK